MTVIDLLDEGDRNLECWSNQLPLDLPIKETIAPLSKKWNHVVWPSQIEIKVKELRIDHLATLIVEPTSLEYEKLIRQYRDDVSEQLGVRAPNHLAYGLHISLAYRTFDLEESEWEVANVLVKKINQNLDKREIKFTLDEPEFCYFPDMSAFVKVDGNFF